MDEESPEIETLKRKTRPKDKGLRKLAERSHEIIIKMGEGSYKEVSAELIKQMKK